MSIETFPNQWRVALVSPAVMNAVVVGELVIAAATTSVLAFDKRDGSPAWTRSLTGKVAEMVVAGDCCVVVTREKKGDRIQRLDANGEIRWSVDGWSVSPSAIGADSQRVAVAGFFKKRRLIGEFRVADGSVVSELVASARSRLIPVPNGWVWIDNLEPAARLRASDGARIRELATIEAWAIARIGNRVYADIRDGDGGRVQAYDLDRGLLWTKPGGASTALLADDEGVVCARLDGVADGSPVSIVSYDRDGSERWAHGPYAACRPALGACGELVLAATLNENSEAFVEVLTRAEGKAVHRAAGTWASRYGITVDGDAIYGTFLGVLARYDRKTFPRIEDAWSVDYVRGLVHQFEIPEKERRRLDALIDAGDVDSVREALATWRTEKRKTASLESSWTAVESAADWPLAIPAQSEGPGIPSIEHPPPDGRIELLHLEDMDREPIWSRRKQFTRFVNVRYLSLTNTRIHDDDIEIAFERFPRLEYLDLCDNSLGKVPANVRSCRALRYLSLRNTVLLSIAPEELPPTLRYLHLGKNPLPPEQIARLREVMPECTVVT